MTTPQQKRPAGKVYARAWVRVMEKGRQRLLEEVARAEGAYLALGSPWDVQIIADRDVILRAVKVAGQMAADYEVGRVQALLDAFENSDYNVPDTLRGAFNAALDLADDEEGELWEITDWGEYHASPQNDSGHPR